MPALVWECAHGDSPPVVLENDTTVDISPPDDSVDSNMVQITGNGHIRNFGLGPGFWITKRVEFLGNNVTLVDGPNLVLLTGANRSISGPAYGTYRCDSTGVWTEISFNNFGAMSMEDVKAKLQDLEARISQLEKSNALSRSRNSSHRDK